MDQHKACDFWQIVVNRGATLCALLDAPPTGQGLQKALQHIAQILETLRNAAADIDPLLSVEVDQVPANDGAMLRIAVSCNHDPNGIEVVQELVTMAPVMPPRIQVYAFAQPVPKKMARELGSLNILGREVAIQHVRFLAEASAIVPGTFDVTCFVPTSALTEMDLQGVPGALVANFVLSMGIGELRMMTRLASIGIAVTDQAPPEALQAWDLVEIIDSAPVH